ncbi:MAG: HEAT repeat domain-containing protein [Treponema sp.]|nr:HEAT repeat domain-containing protein [Treponema sp.]
MLTFKRFFILAVTALFTVSAAMGQRSDREMSIEESYLQESIELMIIRETARSESMDQKLIALEYIAEAIDRGNTGTEIKQALEFLSIEGTVNQTRENGRLVNNFPTVRRQAAKYLGQLGTDEAKTALFRVCMAENEPMVLQEAVKSLGDIGLNENNETVRVIAWVVSRFDVHNPDNLLALSAVDAFDKLSKSGGTMDPNAVQLLVRIADGNYVRPVQERARQVLMDMRGVSR